jgi:hypothetical protein
MSSSVKKSNLSKMLYAANATVMFMGWSAVVDEIGHANTYLIRFDGCVTPAVTEQWPQGNMYLTVTGGELTPRESTEDDARWAARWQALWGPPATSVDVAVGQSVSWCMDGYDKSVPLEEYTGVVKQIYKTGGGIDFCSVWTGLDYRPLRVVGVGHLDR